jgi:hypothetical protein
MSAHLSPLPSLADRSPLSPSTHRKRKWSADILSPSISSSPSQSFRALTLQPSKREEQEDDLREEEAADDEQEDNADAEAQQHSSPRPAASGDSSNKGGSVRWVTIQVDREGGETRIAHSPQLPASAAPPAAAAAADSANPAAALSSSVKSATQPLPSSSSSSSSSLLSPTSALRPRFSTSPPSGLPVLQSHPRPAHIKPADYAAFITALTPSTKLAKQAANCSAGTAAADSSCSLPLTRRLSRRAAVLPAICHPRAQGRSLGSESRGSG